MSNIERDMLLGVGIILIAYSLFSNDSDCVRVVELIGGILLLVIGCGR